MVAIEELPLVFPHPEAGLQQRAGAGPRGGAGGEVLLRPEKTLPVRPCQEAQGGQPAGAQEDLRHLRRRRRGRWR